jgi:hypothetical protein
MSKGPRVFLGLLFAIIILAGITVLAWSIPLPSYQEGHYIPRDLEDAHAELIKHLPPAELQRIRDMKTADEMVYYHFDLGMGLRNEWGLWRGSRLSRRLNLMGIWHPDNMSGVILETGVTPKGCKLGVGKSMVVEILP